MMRKSLDDPQTRASILTRLDTLTPESARRWGRMNSHQAICHLSDSFRAALNSVSVWSNTSLLNRTFVRWIALHSNFRWPHGVKTMLEVDQEIGGTKPVDFDRDKQQLVYLIEQFAERTRANLQPHPILGPLTNEEWQHWGYLHMDHHLRQFGK
jgi:Protein of unknown function (DUF1569)